MPACLNPTRSATLARGLLVAALALATLMSLSAARAAQAPAPEPFVLSGSTLEGQPFSTDKLRGRIVLIYYWHTDCAVCLDKMPELRANVAGWSGKAFTLVTVQVDKQLTAAQRYWQLVGTARAGARQGPVLWRGAADFHDSLAAEPSHWPVSILLDEQGRLLERWEGRIPAQAWDRIADLLP